MWKNTKVQQKKLKIAEKEKTRRPKKVYKRKQMLDKVLDWFNEGLRKQSWTKHYR